MCVIIEPPPECVIITDALRAVLAFRLSAVLFAFAMALAGKLFYFVIERAAEPVSNILATHTQRQASCWIRLNRLSRQSSVLSCCIHTCPPFDFLSSLLSLAKPLRVQPRGAAGRQDAKGRGN